MSVQGTYTQDSKEMLWVTQVQYLRGVTNATRGAGHMHFLGWYLVDSDSQINKVGLLSAKNPLEVSYIAVLKRIATD